MLMARKSLADLNRSDSSHGQPRIATQSTPRTGYREHASHKHFHCCDHRHLTDSGWMVGHSEMGQKWRPGKRSRKFGPNDALIGGWPQDPFWEVHPFLSKWPGISVKRVCGRRITLAPKMGASFYISLGRRSLKRLSPCPIVSS
jgi:hypothetical protein